METVLFSIALQMSPDQLLRSMLTLKDAINAARTAEKINPGLEISYSNTCRNLSILKDVYMSKVTAN